MHYFLRAMLFTLVGLGLSMFSKLYALSAIACAIYFILVAMLYLPNLGSFGGAEERKANLKMLNDKLDALGK